MAWSGSYFTVPHAIAPKNRIWHQHQQTKKTLPASMRPPMADGPRLMWSVLKSVDESATTTNNYNKSHHNHCTTTILRPFFPGPPRWAGARRELLDFMVQGKINRGRHTDHPAGHHSIQTNQCQCPPPPSPHIFLLARCPSCRPTNSVKLPLIQINEISTIRWTCRFTKKYKCTNYVTVGIRTSKIYYRPALQPVTLEKKARIKQKQPLTRVDSTCGSLLSTSSIHSHSQCQLLLLLPLLQWSE